MTDFIHNIDFLTLIGSVILILNMILATVVIFLEKRNVGSTWAWLLILYFAPIFGFILYLFLGKKLPKGHLFEWEDQKKIGIEEMIADQIAYFQSERFTPHNEAVQNYSGLIYMLLDNNDAVLTTNNSIKIFTDGKEKFRSLFDDIQNAKDTIHLQYYIFKRDNFRKAIDPTINRKGKEGIKVRILYDDLGSRGTRKRHFKKLIAAGGEVEAFFPSTFALINYRINYRNHRKLVIIDGKTGYVGGFNVGDEYLGLNKRFGYWRDTHLRIVGDSVHAIQTRFISDWNQASESHDIDYAANLFPKIQSQGQIGMQIVTSGPDSEWEHIKYGYIKMISYARESIWIQTPYFIPDASLLDSLKIACLTGKDVRIMIPNKPDHPFVYWATYFHVGEMLKAGAKVYIYDNGFIHAKTIVIDGKLSSVGTANIDVRSFKLNFEVNAFLYDEGTAASLTECFKRDLVLSKELTLDEYKQRSLKIRFKESISRLLSPIL